MADNERRARQYGPASFEALDSYMFSRLIERTNYGMSFHVPPSWSLENIKVNVLGDPGVSFRRADALLMACSPARGELFDIEGPQRAYEVPGVSANAGHGITARTSLRTYEKFLSENPLGSPGGFDSPERVRAMYASIRDALPAEDVPAWLNRMLDGSPEGDALLRDDFNAIRDEFSALLDAGVAPLSPVNPSLSDLVMMQKSGNRMLFAHLDVTHGRDGSVAFSGWPMRPVNSAPSNPWYNLDDSKATDLGVFRSADLAVTGENPKLFLRDWRERVAELSGAARLRPYMTAEEYDNICGNYGSESWLAGGRDKDGNRVYMSDAKAKMCAELMEKLREAGISYKVMRDSRPGQVKMVFGNDMSMRLIDPYDGGQYAGTRVYHKGLTVYYNTITNEVGGKGAPKEFYNMTSDLAFQLVRTAMGGEVENRAWTFHNDKNMRIMTSLAAEKMNGRPIGAPVPDNELTTDTRLLSVYFANDMSPKTADYDAEPGTQYYGGKFVRDSVASAREGFAREMYANGILAASVRYHENKARYDAAMARYDAMITADPDVDAELPNAADYDLDPPEFSTDETVAKYQEDMWNVLTSDPQNPDVMTALYAEYGDRESAVRFLNGLAGLRDRVWSDEVENAERYDLSALTDALCTHVVGDVQLDAEGKIPEDARFDPVVVTRYMQSAYGVFRRTDELVAACRSVGLTEDYCQGEGFQNSSFNERLRRYQGERDVERPASGKYYSRGALAASARGETDLSKYELSAPQPGFGYDENGMPTHWPMAQDGDKFVRDMSEVVRTSLLRNGCVDFTDEDIQIDANGTVHYESARVVNGKGKLDRVVGEIGPFCRQMGEYVGSPETGDERYDVPYEGLFDDGTRLFVPGNEARIVANKPGESLPYEDRIRVRSYFHVLADETERRLQLDLFKKPFMDRTMYVGEPTSLAYVTRHLFDTRFPRDFMDKDAVHGMSQELREAIVATNRARVKIADEQMEGSSRVALFRARTSDAGDFLNDNFASPISLTGGRNPAILEQPGDAYFDPVLTGNGGSIGIRYMRADRTVDREGRIVPRSDEEIEALKSAGRRPDRCAIMDYLIRTGRCPDNDAIDRAIMTGQGLLHGLVETEPVGVAQMSLGAMTLEDGIVISDEFAQKYQVLTADDEPVLRPLTQGDKMECHGNKGVVGAVVKTRSFFMKTELDRMVAEAEAAGETVDERRMAYMRRAAEDMYEAELLKTRQENPILARAMDVFNENPELSVCMSPYSSVSRFNGGLAAEAMRVDNTVDDLRIPQYGEDGWPTDEVTVKPGCIGHVKMTILEQTADSKTHYEMDGSPNRSYGAQMTWALAAAGADEVLKDSFANNDRALVDLREMLLAVGMDVDQVGHIITVDPDKGLGYNPQVVGEDEAGNPVMEERKVFTIPRPDYAKTLARVREEFAAKPEGERVNELVAFAHKSKATKGLTAEQYRAMETEKRRPIYEAYMRSLVKPALEAELKQVMSDFDAFAQGSGGFVEIPFDIKYPGYGTSDQQKGSIDGSKFHTARSKNGFLLPVMSSRLRSGREFPDGTMARHDYTNYYIKIVRAAWEYYAMKPGTTDPRTPGYDPDKDLEAGAYWRAGVTGNKTKSFDAIWKTIPTNAQEEYDKITSDLATRRFEGKHNVFRSRLMAAKQRNSATAIWTPDPSCPVDAVKMPGSMMAAVGLDPDSTEDQYVLTHRDPVLQQSGIRYMRVIRDDELTGVAVHPAGIPGGMDGDFDGDTVGEHAPSGKKAKKNAMDKLSVVANLLDKSAEIPNPDWALTDPKTGKKLPAFKLFITDGQDIAAGHAVDPSLKARRDELERRVNLFEQAFVTGEAVLLPGETEPCVVRRRAPKSGKGLDGVAVKGLDDLRRQAVASIDGYLRDCSLAGFGRNVVSYAGPKEHIESLLQFVEDGCKGSKGKVETYAAHAGINYKADMANLDDVGFVHEDHRSVASRAENVGILKSKEFQQEYTGMGGQSSIRGMKVLMDIMPDASTRVTKAATQAILQCKHDAEMADIYELLLMTECRSIWRSEDMSGRRGSLTPDEFVQRFNETYNDGMKLGVSQYQLSQVVEALTVKGEDGAPDYVLDIEGDEALKFCSVLRQCAYDGNLDTVREIASRTTDALERGQEADGLFDVAPGVVQSGKAYHNYNRCLAGRQMQRNLELADGGYAVVAKDTQFAAPEATSNLVAQIQAEQAVSGPQLRVTAGSHEWARGEGTQTRRNSVGQLRVSPESKGFKGKNDPEAGHLYYVGLSDAARADGETLSLSAVEMDAARREFLRDAVFLNRVASDIPGMKVDVVTYGKGWDYDASTMDVEPEDVAVVETMLSGLGSESDARNAAFVENRAETLELGSNPDAAYAIVYKSKSEDGTTQTITRSYDDPTQMLEYARLLTERVHEAWPEDELSERLEFVVPEDDFATRYCVEAAMTNGQGKRMTVDKATFFAQAEAELVAKRAAELESGAPKAPEGAVAYDMPETKSRERVPVGANVKSVSEVALSESDRPAARRAAAEQSIRDAVAAREAEQMESVRKKCQPVTGLSDEALRAEYGEYADGVREILADAEKFGMMPVYDATAGELGLAQEDGPLAAEAGPTNPMLVFTGDAAGSYEALTKGQVPVAVSFGGALPFDPDDPDKPAVGFLTEDQVGKVVTRSECGVSTTHYEDVGAMMGETMFLNWVTQAARYRGQPSQARMDFLLNDSAVASQTGGQVERVRNNMLKVQSRELMRSTFASTDDKGRVFCGSPAFGESSKDAFAGRMSYSVSGGGDGKSKTVTLWRGYNDLNHMSHQMCFLADAIEARWPGEAAKDHALKVELSPECASYATELNRQLSYHSKYGVEVSVMKQQPQSVQAQKAPVAQQAQAPAVSVDSQLAAAHANGLPKDLPQAAPEDTQGEFPNN